MGQPYGSGTAGFGLVSAGTVGVLVLLAAMAIWIARRECLLRGLWARVCSVAVIGRVVAWAREQISARGWALARRLPPYEVAIVALLLGSAVVAALAAGFTEVLEDVLEGEGIAGIDQPAAGWLASHRDLWLTGAAGGHRSRRSFAAGCTGRPDLHCCRLAVQVVVARGACSGWCQRNRTGGRHR